MVIDVQAPAVQVPTDEMFFSKEHPDRPDLAFLKDHFYREGRITEDQAIYILQKATDILRTEPNLLDVDAPITGKCAANECHARVREREMEHTGLTYDSLDLHFWYCSQSVATFMDSTMT